MVEICIMKTITYRPIEYTDTICNYGFYEHLGFERLEEQSILLNFRRM